MKYHTSIVWLRNDLRLHDHQALTKAAEQSQFVLPVYCLDPEKFTPGSLGFARIGKFRAQFLRESLEQMKESLQSIGANLIVCHEPAPKALPLIAKLYNAQSIFFHREIATEEQRDEEKVRQNASRDGIDVVSYQGNDLIHPDELPFSQDTLPDVFTKFRKKVEKNLSIQPPLPTLTTLQTPSLLKQHSHIHFPSYIPSNLAHDSRRIYPFTGGEKNGLHRIQQYFWKTHLIQHYKHTRNNLYGDYSSKFSPWLAIGNISAHYLYAQLKKYESECKKNQSTYWLFFELLWREYFRHAFRKHGTKYFCHDGLSQNTLPSIPNTQAFHQWIQGTTGVDFIDANMTELKLTGFMSNRGRQNVASFLVKDMQLPWTWGASYFESQLIDYDVHSNWGNWAYIAGVGNDSRKDRFFDTAWQAERYDPQRKYVSIWMPHTE